MKDFKSQIIFVPIDQVKPYEKNSKIHSREQVTSIAKQIVQFGFDQPIVVDPDFVIIKGHGRLQAAQYLNLQEVPVIIQSLTKDEAVAARIADNKVAESPWDEQKLKEELRSLSEINFDLELTGFSDEEYKALLQDFEKQMDYSALDSAPADARVEQMSKGIRKAIMVDFAPGDYDEAYLMFKFFRDRGSYLGGLIMTYLREEKARLETQEAIN